MSGRRHLLGPIVRRGGRLAATVALAFVLVFVAIRLTPGGPAVAMLGQRASAREVARINEEYGWDKPIGEQLAHYAVRAVQGDLGRSWASPGQPPISQELRRRFPATLELSLAALSLAVPIGLAAGVLAAAFRGRMPDRIVIALASLGGSIPVFFLGILLLTLLPGIPGSGRIDVRIDPRTFELTGLYTVDTLLAGRVDLWIDSLRHLLLPAITLASIPTAIIARITRASLIEVFSSDFIRTAAAKGVPPWRLLRRHALPAAMGPILALTGMQMATLLAGAVLTETVFQWPGMGRFMLAASLSKDYNALQGGVLLLGIVLVLVNVATDLLIAYFDPRLSSGSSRLAEGS